MIKKIFKNLIVIMLLCNVFICCGNITFFAYSEENISIEKHIDNTFEYLKLDNNFIINSNYLDNATSSYYDWNVMNIGRYNYKDKTDDYLLMSYEKVKEKYKTNYKLDKNKATEWHRISLTLDAIGGNPRNIGNIDLIADGTYNRSKLGKQGITGYIWALISLDSKAYGIPQNSIQSRLDIISNIVQRQNSDNGFSLMQGISEVDITAMVITALSPYYNINNKFMINNKEKTIHEVIDEALVFLSKTQTKDGEFSYYDIKNCESTAQVIVALNSLNINPLTDTRFIKNGITLLDVLLKYKTENNGFKHSLDSSNDNGMATQQALTALISLYRQQNNMNSFYDMRKEINSDYILDVKNSINNINDKDSTILAVDKYNQLDFFDRKYINNFSTLKSNLLKYNLKIKEIDINYLNIDVIIPKNDIVFSSADINLYNSLINKNQLSTKYYTDIVKLKNILENCKDFDSKNEFSTNINKLYNNIKDINLKITNLNKEIDALYPYNNISFKDREKINNLEYDYNNLSEYDKTKINNYKYILTCKSLLANKLISLIIGICVTILLISLTVLFIIMKKVKAKHKNLNILEESEE